MLLRSQFVTSKTEVYMAQKNVEKIINRMENV